MSAALLAVLLPLMLAIAVAIVLDDGRPIIFRQLRAGLHGQPFSVLKFRTMRSRHVRSTSLPAEFEWQGGVPDGFVFKSGSTPDDRITRTGHFLRRSSLDELPQLWNVLLGQMSLIGPRPEILPIVEHYNEDQARRLTVRPGITGWAQVTGRSAHSHGEKIAADLYYIDNLSPWLDLRISLRTLAVPLHRSGAY